MVSVSAFLNTSSRSSIMVCMMRYESMTMRVGIVPMHSETEATKLVLLRQDLFSYLYVVLMPEIDGVGKTLSIYG